MSEAQCNHMVMDRYFDSLVHNYGGWKCRTCPLTIPLAAQPSEAATVSRPFEKFTVSDQGRTNDGRERMFEVRVELGETFPLAEKQRAFIEQAIRIAIRQPPNAGEVRRQALEEAAEIANSVDLPITEFISPHHASVKTAVKIREAIRALAAKSLGQPEPPVKRNSAESCGSTDGLDAGPIQMAGAAKEAGGGRETELREALEDWMQCHITVSQPICPCDRCRKSRAALAPDKPQL